MSGVARASIAALSKAMLPALARHNPMMVRKVVVLPAPLRPSSTVSLPTGTVRLTPCRMW